MLNRLRLLLPGIFLCGVLGIISALVSRQVGGPVLLYALLLGLALHPFSARSSLAEGIGFSAGTILKFGVALLGIRISAEQILALGALPLTLVLVSIPATILFGLAVSRGLGMTRSQGVLSGGAVSICGASAAMALAAVLPQRPDSERQLAFTIIGVTALSTLAMLLYPLLSTLLQLTSTEAGFFLGGTIHNVPQAVAAGFTVSDPAGDTATFIKLLRVAMLAPVVLVISMTVVRGGHASSGGASIPGFLLAFAALVVVNSLGWIPAEVREPLDALSRACLVVAIAAIGIKTSFRELTRLGWRPVLLLVLETLFLAALVLAGLLLFN